MAEQSEQGIPGSALRVLIVEDSAIQAEKLKRVLNERGYDVLIARDGAEGLERARAERPNIVISDIIMPVMDGYEMCRKLREDEAFNGTPIILLTQLFEPEDVIKGLETAADCYITKPYQPERLVSKIREIFETPIRCINRPDIKGMELIYLGKSHVIHAGRTQTLNFLISTYENSIITNMELEKAHNQLREFNEQLEKKVAERTESLRLEIEERKRAENSLKESEQRMRTIADTAGDAIVCIKPPGLVYFWNRKAEEMFGYAASEAIGRDFQELIVPERYREKKELEGLTAFFQTGTGSIVGKTTELAAMRKNRTEFSVELSVSAMNMNGERHATAIIRDITERKNAEYILRQNFEELEKFNKLMVGRELQFEEVKKELRILKPRVLELEEENEKLRLKIQELEKR